MNVLHFVAGMGLFLLLIPGMASAELNLTGVWVNSQDDTMTIIIGNDTGQGIWSQNSSTGRSESIFSITPLVDNYLLVQSPESGVLIGISQPGSGLSLYNLTASDLKKEDGSIPVYHFVLRPPVNSSTDKGIFLSGYSTGVGAYQKEQTGADSAGIEGNERFDSKSPISCDNDMCTCDGESCRCSGPDCQCEGGDCVKNDNGYSCKGWDCWFVCKGGDNCKIS